MKSIIMHKIVNFIYNTNVDEVENIYKGKVKDYMLGHLIDKKNKYKEYRINNNSLAWLDFIGNLDEQNSEILFDFINNRKR